ncbi:MAG: hypothetical protein Q9187_001528 [Circinaria calcarea]
MGRPPGVYHLQDLHITLELLRLLSLLDSDSTPQSQELRAMLLTTVSPEPNKPAPRAWQCRASPVP